MDRLGPLLKLLLLLAISRTPLSAAVTTTSSGLQTNFGDVSFAGGMSYDSEHEIVYVTGQVGAHSCFVGILKRVAASTTSSSDHPTHLEFLSRQVFDERSICQTIAFRKDISRPGNALLLGLSEEGGLLTDKREEGSHKATQYGAMLSLEYSASGESSIFHPEKSVLMYPAAVTIPRSITNDPTRTNRVFVATMTSDSTDIQFRDALGSPHVSDGGGGGVTTTPNLTPGGGLLKYGKNFAMTVESIRLATEFSSAEPQWRKPFGVKRNSDSVKKNGVTVNQIIFRQGSKQEDAPDDTTDDALYVVGSTLGSGPAFGEPEFDNDKGYGTIVGFITKLDPDTGGLTSSRRFIFNPNENSENRLPNTYIEAVCDSTDDEDAIYVVGSYDRSSNDGRFRFLQNEEIPARPEREAEVPTEIPTETPTMFPSDKEFDDDAEFDDDSNTSDNDGDKGSTTRNKIATPFIAKLRASTLETIWQKDFESTTNARALGCGIDPKSKSMYVAGNVENGGELAGRTTSMSGDDVFLLRLDTTDGDVSWWKQLGTASDDRLAYGGSGLVVLEEQQGVILMGDTTSNLYSVSSQDSEIFIVEIDADGNLPETTEFSRIDNSPGASLVKLSKPKKVGGEEQTDSSTSKQTKTEISTDESGSADTPDAPDSTFTDSVSSTGHTSYFYSFVSVCLLVFAIFGFCICRAEKGKREATERALVFSYLQDFDLEDIDVKQAATGGFHGTYIGSLAQGLNVLQNETVSSSDGSWHCGNEDVEQKLSKLSHSSVVRDILFMDYDDSVFSSVNSDKNDDGEDQTQEKDGIVRDPSEIIDEDEDGNKVDPWGTEII